MGRTPPVEVTKGGGAMRSHTIASRTSMPVAALASLSPVAALASLSLVAALVLLLFAAPAFGADGRRLLPDTDPVAAYPQDFPKVSGRVVVFCATPPGMTQRVYACDAGAAPAGAWPVDAVLGHDQLEPCVLTRGAIVRIVWTQNDGDSEYDLYLWEGQKNGVAAAGFPKKLIDRPYGRDAGNPSIGVTRVAGKDHVVVAWSESPSVNRPEGIAAVHWLDLTRDADGDGTPDYKDSEFDPTAAGTLADPGMTGSQFQPDVGAKGIFWLDSATEDPLLQETSISRLDLSPASPNVTRFYQEEPGSGFDATCLRATGAGAAWLRSADYPGSGMEPVAKAVGGTMKVVTFLNNPWVFDVEGSAYAFTQGHGGTTSGDADVFFYTSSIGQIVGVCTVGSPVYDRHLAQDKPAISAAPGGYRVVWCDPRGATSPGGLMLYQALVPTVTIAANRTTVKRGGSVTFTARVAPDHAGYAVKFQTGTRNVMTTQWGTNIWFTNVTTKKTKDLGAGSKAVWTWTPTKRGTYYWNVAFGGSKKYVAKTGYGANHVGSMSRWLKIVVR